MIRIGVAAPVRHHRLMSNSSLQHRVSDLAWPGIADELAAHGHATTGPLLDLSACREIVAWYADEARFRNRVIMERHAFGQGEYKYFAYPLPMEIAALREALYRRLAPVANAWAEALGTGASYPETLAEYLELCHRAGQIRPTPLLLRYEANGYNCLHQDLYGDLAFPLQATILLSDPARDFDGGEFVLVEQRPRQQSRAEVVRLRQGEAVIFAVRERPRQGARGVHRAILRHGVSRIRRGLRFALGIIFHDAK
jgi:hypothetical protein